jgi:hypothetical protein
MAVADQPYQPGLAPGSYWGDLPENFSAANAGTARKSMKQSSEEENHMETKPISKPRGGLAADAQALKTTKTRSVKPKGTKKAKVKKGKTAKAKTGGATKGALGKLFENSVVRVVMAAGKAGATFENVQKALSKHNIKAADATIKRNLYLGKSGKEKGAELTAAQLAEFGV